jgi:general stress protein 26
MTINIIYELINHNFYFFTDKEQEKFQLVSKQSIVTFYFMKSNSQINMLSYKVILASLESL